MLGPKRRGDDPSEWQLSRFGFGEPHGERAERLHTTLAHGRDDEARVQPTAEKHPERDIAHELDVDRLDEPAPELVRGSSKVRESDAARLVCRQRPVRLDVDPAIPPFER